MTPDLARRIDDRLVSIAPDAIDVVHARHGKTLRYHGLPFARVRQVLGCEWAWFGLEVGDAAYLNIVL